MTLSILGWMFIKQRSRWRFYGRRHGLGDSSSDKSWPPTHKSFYASIANNHTTTIFMKR